TLYWTGRTRPLSSVKGAFSSFIQMPGSSVGRTGGVARRSRKLVPGSDQHHITRRRFDKAREAEQWPRKNAKRHEKKARAETPGRRLVVCHTPVYFCAFSCFF